MCNLVYDYYRHAFGEGFQQTGIFYFSERSAFQKLEGLRNRDFEIIPKSLIIITYVLL